MVNKWLNFIQSAILPSRCLLCSGYLPKNHDTSPQPALCEGCWNDLPWLSQCCTRCGIPLPTRHPVSAVCGQCLNKPPPFEQSHCLFHYEYPVDRMINGLKFKHKLTYGRLFGRLMAEHLRHTYRHQPFPDAVIPVPLHSARLRERGFNQAHEIAIACAHSLNLPLRWQLCQRVRPTPHQIGLDAATRRKNLKSAFRVRRSCNLNCVALVDDVMTTGSTLTELSRILKKAGVQSVHNWCIARTTPPR